MSSARTEASTKDAIIGFAVIGAVLFGVVQCATGDDDPAGTSDQSAPEQVAPAGAAPTGLVGEEATVTDVVDGETVDVQTAAGVALTVRVLGIDAPETYDGTECWGPEATAFAVGLLSGQTVGVATDPTQDDVDRDGRSLRYLILPDGANYSVLAAEAGAANSHVDDGPVAEHAAIVAAEQRAEAAGAGLWGAPCYGVTDDVTPEPEPEPVSEPKPVSEPTEEVSSRGVAYFPNCSAARSAGAAPLYAGDSGYSSKLDRDGDGVACES